MSSVMSQGRIGIDPHTHSIVSGHAYSTIREMAEYAAGNGMTILGITDHGPRMQTLSGQEYFMNFEVVDRKAYGLRLLLGAEADITGSGGEFDLDDDVLARLEIVVASFHRQCFTAGSVKDNTRAFIDAIERPFTCIAGHPDDGRFPVEYEEVVRAAVDNHVLLEVNNRSLTERSFRLNGRENCIRMLEECERREAYVVMSSDAHVDTEVGEVSCSINLLEELDYPRERIVNYNEAMFLTYLNDI